MTDAEIEALVRGRDEALAALADIVDPNKATLVAYQDGRWDIRSPVFPIFVATMAQMLAAVDAENYVEIECDHEEAGPLVLTIQRKWGKKPSELKAEAEAERDQAREQHALVREENDSLAARVREVEAELAAERASPIKMRLQEVARLLRIAKRNTGRTRGDLIDQAIEMAQGGSGVEP